MSSPFNIVTRAAELADAAETELDVLVVGMGATGAGVALDAASRGLRVAVVDKGDRLARHRQAPPAGPGPDDLRRLRDRHGRPR